MANPRIWRIGLTGGIGSGKSTVADLFVEQAATDPNVLCALLLLAVERIEDRRPRLPRRLVDLQLLPHVVVSNPHIKRVYHAYAHAFDVLRAKRLLSDVATLAGVTSARLSFGVATGGLWQAGHASSLVDRGRSADGACGVLDLRWTRALGLKGSIVAGEFLLPRAAFAEALRIPRFEAFSSFPPATRDVAVIVPAATAAGEVLNRVQQAAAKAAGKEFALESVNCFDVFSGPGLPEGTRSVAFEVRWRHAARTLTDEEANRAMAAVIAALEKGAGWTIRR